MLKSSFATTTCICYHIIFNRLSLASALISNYKVALLKGTLEKSSDIIFFSSIGSNGTSQLRNIGIPDFLAKEQIAFTSSQENLNSFCTIDEMRHPMFIFNPSTRLAFFDAMEQMCEYFKNGKNSNYQKLSWLPSVALLWPDFITSTHDFQSEIQREYSQRCLIRGNSFPINTNVFVVTETNTFELYSLQNRTIFKEINYGLSKLRRRRDFGGMTLRAVAMYWVDSGKVESVKSKEENGELFFSNDYNARYLDTMVRPLNIKVTQVTGEGRLMLNSNGTLEGIGKQLMEGQADISIMQAEYMVYRAKYLHYLHPHIVSRITAYFKQPSATSVRDIYIGSIKHDLGIAVICAWLLILLALAGISYTISLYCEYDVSSSEDGNISYASRIWISALCQQGTHNQPKSLPLKLGFLTTLFFNLIIYIGFSSSIVCQLSAPYIPINSFNDVLYKSDISIYNDNVTQSASEYLNNAKDQGWIKPSTRSKGSTITAQAIPKMIHEGIAYLSQAHEFYYLGFSLNYTSRFFCEEISEVDVNPFSVPLMSGMLVRKDLPYTEFLKHVQLQMREVGVHQKLHKKYVGVLKHQCPNIRGPELPKLGLNDTITAFGFFIFFAILSFVILVLEILSKRSLNPTPQV